MRDPLFRSKIILIKAHLPLSKGQGTGFIIVLDALIQKVVTFPYLMNNRKNTRQL